MAFDYWCKVGNIEKVEYDLKHFKNDEIYYGSNKFYYGFKGACEYGQLKIVKLMLSLDHQDKKISIHGIEDCFRISCENGHLEIVELLLSLNGDQTTSNGLERKINIHKKDDEAFKSVCYFKHIKLVELFLSLEGERKINIHKLIKYCFRRPYHLGDLEMVEFFLISCRELINKLKLPRKTRNPKINFLLECLKKPINFDPRILEYKPKTRLICVKQTLLNLCFIEN